MYKECAVSIHIGLCEKGIEIYTELCDKVKLPRVRNVLLNFKNLSSRKVFILRYLQFLSSSAIFNQIV